MNHNQFVELDTKDKVLLSNLITKAEHNSQTYKKIDERHDHKLNLGNIYLYFSKFHNTWFVSNISFIENYFYNLPLKEIVTTTSSNFDGEINVSVSDGLFSYYNKDEKIMNTILGRKYYAFPEKSRQRTDKFYEFSDVSMVNTDKYIGSENILQKQDESNCFFDYQLHHEELEKLYYDIFKLKYSHEIMDINQIFVRTSEIFNDQPIYKLYIPYPELKHMYLKHIDTDLLYKQGFNKYQIQTVHKEKFFHKYVSNSLNLTNIISDITDHIMEYIFDQCYLFTKQKMKKNSCMWMIINNKPSYNYDTRYVINSLLFELFCEIRNNVSELFNVEHFVSVIYQYLLYKDSIVFNLSDKNWDKSDQMKKFQLDTINKLEKYQRKKIIEELPLNQHSLSLLKNIKNNFVEKKLNNDDLTILIISQFNKYFPKLVKGSCSS